jgi:hypothetical protein
MSKHVLRILATILALAAGIFWLSRGANRGWTRNQVEIRQTDAVTGIEGVTYRKQFEPGLEFLAGAWLTAGILAGASFFFGNKQTQNSHKPTLENP